MAFLLKAMGFTDAIPNFPFTPIESTSSSSSSSSAPYRAVYDISQRHVGCSSNYAVQMVNGVNWTVRQGRASDDKKKLVSIFTCHYGSNARVADLAKNALKRAKSLVLPGFLKVHGAADYHDTVHIATDPCVPLRQVLTLPAARHYFFSSAYHTEEDTKLGVAEDTESFHESLALGLRSVGGALNSLHRNHLIHGNVCADTVFVLASSGAWRLFGLELVSTAGEPNALYYSTAADLLPRGRLPPEVQQSRRDLIPSLNVGHVDAWGLGLLIAQTAGVSAAEAAQGRLDNVEAQAGASGTFLSPAQLRDQMPQDLVSSFQALTNQSPQSRMTLPAFLDKTALLLKSELVQTYAELEEISLRDSGQRERFFDRLNTTIARFPCRFCLCTLVSKLVESLQTGAVANVVQPIAHVASRLPKAPVLKSGEAASPASLMVDNDFDVFLTPAFTALYQSTDSLLRYRLLEHASLYAAHMPSKTATEVIWPLYIRSFTSQASSVREYSARALVHLAPRLSTPLLQKDVPQALIGLQRDSDGAIRTNATICLCLLAPSLPEAERGAILVNGFCRMLKDPFTPSRLAALRSLASTGRYISVAPLAQSVLPAVCPLTVDADGETRAAALAIVQSSLERLQSADVKARQEEASRPATSTAAAGAQPAPLSGTQPPPPSSSSSSSMNKATSSSSAAAGAGGLMSGFSTWMSGASTPAPAAPAAAPYDAVTALNARSDALQPSTAFKLHSGTTAHTTTTTTTTTTANKGGWSDDEDDAGGAGTGGWGTAKTNMDDLFAPAPAQAKPAFTRDLGHTGAASDHVAPANADFSSLFDGMTMSTASSPLPGSPAPGGSAMKLRGKKSGLGATRL